MRGLVAFPIVKQREHPRHVLCLCAGKSDTIRHPVFSSLVYLQCQAQHRGRKSTSEGHISPFSKGKRDETQQRGQESPAPTSFPHPATTSEPARRGDAPAQGRTDPNYFPSLPKQSRNEGVNHSFDLQFEVCFFPRALRKSRVKTITES